MIKEAWVYPETKVQQFMANEYVAACGDSGDTVTYKFECNAQKDFNIFINSGKVYLETNGEPGLQTGRDRYLGSYHPCGQTHKVTVPKGTDVSSIFQEGYFKPSGIFDTSTRNVFVWTDNGTNIHCTMNLGQSTDHWETTKS